MQSFGSALAEGAALPSFQRVLAARTGRSEICPIADLRRGIGQRAGQRKVGSGARRS